VSETPNADEFLHTLFTVPLKEPDMQDGKKIQYDRDAKRGTKLGGALGVIILLAFASCVVTGAVWVVAEIIRQLP
jgi:hypothetical protein